MARSVGTPDEPPLAGALHTEPSDARGRGTNRAVRDPFSPFLGPARCSPRRASPLSPFKLCVIETDRFTQATWTGQRCSGLVAQRSARELTYGPLTMLKSAKAELAAQRCLGERAAIGDYLPGRAARAPLGRAQGATGPQRCAIRSSP
ncbi:hypothetical protein SKAU_G00184430 [Synaphobranchus kaupii]|uniref:Uncharacterized protein n=1 Tax=Synaphobranchus kaupii TaxID=118154 RepID=A0A9Q1FCE9_SYNKA|nr:hypothetical protein SKAU_G00184430 [Synaphobranchus kaupii]